MTTDEEVQSIAALMAIAAVESRIHRRVARALFISAAAVVFRAMSWDTAVTVAAVLALREIIPALCNLRALHLLNRHYRRIVSRV